MSNTNDEEIQRMLEEMKGKDLFSDNEDVNTYRLLFEELKNLPAPALPPHFATDVTARLAASGKHAGAGGNELVLVASVTAIGILCAIGMIIYMDWDIFISPAVLSMLGFALSCILILQSLESNLLKKKFGLKS